MGHPAPRPRPKLPKPTHRSANLGQLLAMDESYPTSIIGPGPIDIARGQYIRGEIELEDFEEILNMEILK